MQPHQQRVVDEKQELDTKLDKLTVFLKGDLFESLPDDEQDRLAKQLGIMSEYSNILAERIAHFPKE